MHIDTAKARRQENIIMDSQKNNFAKRFIMMLTGILFIGVCVGSFRLSAFGVDAFTCMNLGIS